MKLSALAQESGVSTASIKYYIHVGVLRPGHKRNATTADYSQAHADRLRLIICLRRELRSPIDSIAALTRAIDDESLENIELMGLCQRLALEASNVLKSAIPPLSATVPASQATGSEPQARQPRAVIRRGFATFCNSVNYRKRYPQRFGRAGLARHLPHCGGLDGRSA